MTAEQALAASLEDVYGGDQKIEAGAVQDKLLDRGFRLVACRRQVESFDDELALGGANPLGRSLG